MIIATDLHIETIRAQRIDATAREMQAEGVMLSHEQADQLDDAALGWLRSRLGLVVRSTDRGVECSRA